MEEKKLISYIQGKATPKVREEVMSWLNQPGAREALDTIVESYLENSSGDGEDETDYRKLLTDIHKKIQKGSETGRRASWYPKTLLKIAASLLFLGLGIYYVMDGFRSGSKDTALVVEEVSFITKETRVGEKLTLTFPDGTKAMLNSLSRISFSSTYGKSDRVVVLEGEAFFEIAADEKRPFRLETGPVTTTALGTAFNAFSREGQIKIALTDGRVSVESVDQMVKLTPGEMAFLEDSDVVSELSVTSFDPSRVVAWKDGRIVFDNKPLKDILNDLETWYGVQVDVKKGVDLNRRVIGEFNNRSLKDILVGLDFSMGLEHKIVGDQVTIKSN